MTDHNPASDTRKTAIANRLTAIATEESQLLINRPRDLPMITWAEYLAKTDLFDAERKELRSELHRLCVSTF